MGGNVLLKLKSKAFVFTLEALLCAVLIVSFIIQLNLFENKNLELLDVIKKQEELDKSNLFGDLLSEIDASPHLDFQRLGKETQQSLLHYLF